MAFVQRRKGPDVVGSFGLLQPLADGLKLILKEPISPSSANFSLFRMAPVATFMLSLVAWAVVPFDYGVYGIIIAVILKLPCLVEKKRTKRERSLSICLALVDFPQHNSKMEIPRILEVDKSDDSAAVRN
ncbi:NADH dehydrogenase I subunit 6 [Canna indica]|uniref:NADH dehydrogenase I subunit 6 n=1 Tax=Canna indica TaxID=4628 RepID=A0AAQ3KW54_9LILI|nr:NADH dehydrogenase I subunit 6 [Canna indica]